MESKHRSLSTEDKTLIKRLVESVHSIEYINIDVIYQHIQNILDSMNKEELENSIKTFHDYDDADEYYDNPIRKIRRIVLLDMSVQKDLSEMEWEIDNEIEGCISDYFEKNLEDKTGVPFVFDNIEYTSDL
jgi:hypothetical protein